MIDLLIDKDTLDDYKNIRSDKEAIRATKSQTYQYIKENKLLAINTSSLTNELAIEFLKIENEGMFEIIQEDKNLRIKTDKYCAKNGTDYEDTLQYFCAKKSGCNLIVSNDKNFPKLDLPIKRTNPNLEDYLLN